MSCISRNNHLMHVESLSGLDLLSPDNSTSDLYLFDTIKAILFVFTSNLLLLLLWVELIRLIYYCLQISKHLNSGYILLGVFLVEDDFLILFFLIEILVDNLPFSLFTWLSICVIKLFIDRSLILFRILVATDTDTLSAAIYTIRTTAYTTGNTSFDTIKTSGNTDCYRGK